MVAFIVIVTVGFNVDITVRVILDVVLSLFFIIFYYSVNRWCCVDRYVSINLDR